MRTTALHRHPRRRRWPGGLLIVLLMLLPACGGGEAKDPAGRETPAARDEHEDHGGDIRLTGKQLETAGIEVVEAGPGRIKNVLRLTATVGENLDARVHISPRVAGLVRAIHKHLGDRVAEGERLCEIESVELGNAVADYLEARALSRAAEETLAQERRLFETRLATRKRVLDGEIAVARTIFAREKALRDQEISTLRPYLEADKALQQARLEKERQLTELQAERDTRLLALEVDLRRRNIRLKTAMDRLRILGSSERDIRDLEKPERRRLGRYVIRSPIEGVVVKRHITLNEYKDTGETLFEIHDLRQVWILASVYEKDLAHVRRGQSAVVRLNAFPGTSFAAAVTFVDTRVDPTTRATAVRLELPNRRIAAWKEDFPIRPGMFGIAELATGSRPAAVVIPEAAVNLEGEKTFVFVRENPLTYERKAVRVRAGSGGLVEVVEGLKVGDEVVVAGTFVLKSIARSGEMGHGHAH